MSIRFAIVVFAALWFGACGGDAATSDAPPSGIEVIGGQLRVVTSDSITVAPRGIAELQVAYLDGDNEPVRRVDIEFVLEGDAPGVSLSADLEMTDDRGQATVKLTAGSDSASFRVRADADGAEPVYIDVKVLKSAVREARVEARYSGLRSVTKRVVTALPGMGCGAALAAGMPGDLTERYEGSEESVAFEVGPGLHYAFVGWGRDSSNALLAEGCSELDVPVDPVTKFKTVVIDLLDRPMSLTGSYSVTIGLDVAASAKRAGDTAVAGGKRLLTGEAFEDADYFLDAIEAKVRVADAAAADEIASARLSMGISLAERLQDELDGEKVGPNVWLSKLAGQIRTYGSALYIEASYGVTSLAGVPMSITLAAMQSRTTKGKTITLSYDPLSLPAASIDAQYDDARAAIAVETLSVQLALGSYASLLLDAIDARADNGIKGELVADSGCDELVAWVGEGAGMIAPQSPIADACDEDCVRTACTAAIDALSTAARSQLSTLDVNHPSIGVRGELLVFDRDEDGLVDAIGAAALEGSWGQAPEEDKADPVDADFTVVTTLTKL